MKSNHDQEQIEGMTQKEGHYFRILKLQQHRLDHNNDIAIFPYEEKSGKRSNLYVLGEIIRQGFHPNVRSKLYKNDNEENTHWINLLEGAKNLALWGEYDLLTNLPYLSNVLAMIKYLNQRFSHLDRDDAPLKSRKIQKCFHFCDYDRAKQDKGKQEYLVNLMKERLKIMNDFMSPEEMESFLSIANIELEMLTDSVGGIYNASWFDQALLWARIFRDSDSRKIIDQYPSAKYHGKDLYARLNDLFVNIQAYVREVDSDPSKAPVKKELIERLELFRDHSQNIADYIRWYGKGKES